MHYEVFIDVVLAENLVADFVAIHLTQQILYGRHRILKSFMGALLGASLAAVRIIFSRQLRIAVFLIYVVGYGVAMLISFEKSKQIGTQLVIVHLFLMMVGAGGFLTRRMLAWYGYPLPFTGFLIYGMLIDMTGILGIQRYHKWRIRRQPRIYPVWIYFDQNPIMTKALVDTGNQLREPVSGKPVSIMEDSLCAGKDALSISTDAYCVVPYHSIGNENGILHAVRVPMIKIQIENHLVEQKDAVIAFYHGQLSKDMSFRMILQPEVLQI